MKRILSSKILFGLVLAILIAAGSASADPWSFGVISDTQWTIADDHKNPNTCAADIIKQVNYQFIAQGVKLVVHVGDMVDTGNQVNDYTRALYAQDLYNAGIGFYPLRGNHEAANGTYTGSGADYMHAYPQIVPGPYAGVNNSTPGDITTALIPSADLNPISGNPPADKTQNKTFKVGSNFSSPDSVNAFTGGVSYAFDYKNVTFMLLDQFKSPDYYTSYIPDQHPWIESTLSSRPANTHAFAFTHKNLLGGNHKDNMFGGPATGDPGDGYRIDLSTGIVTSIDPSTSISNTPGLTVGQKQLAMSNFLASLEDNKVKYMISGHDHHHYNSVVTSPDHRSKVHQLITASDSSKFYTPVLPVSPNDVPVEQDLARVGYYIFTVDGPRVTIDYYADDHGNWQSDAKFPYYNLDLVNFPLGTTPALTFVKRSTTGYSLNGTENLVAQGASYAMTDDTKVASHMERGFVGTSMAILDGINESKATTNYGRAIEKAVNTGWTSRLDADEMDCSSHHRWPWFFKKWNKAKYSEMPVSDVLTLWGMEDVGSAQADTYVLSMSFDHKLLAFQFGKGLLGLATRDENGDWVNAVDMNSGGTKYFVLGPYQSGYKLGTYGIDLKTHTAWAVINYDGDFAVAGFSHSF